MPAKAIRKTSADNKPTAEADPTSPKPSLASTKRARASRKPRAMPNRDGAEMSTIRQAVDGATSGATKDHAMEDTEKDLQSHLAELEAQPALDDVLIAAAQDEEETGRRQSETLLALREEIDNLKARLAVIKEQAATVVKANAEWADASAHAQLGAYPWGKLAGIMAGVFVAARILRRSRWL